jgi:hypothetical protein
MKGSGRHIRREVRDSEAARESVIQNGRPRDVLWSKVKRLGTRVIV